MIFPFFVTFSRIIDYPEIGWDFFHSVRYPISINILLCFPPDSTARHLCTLNGRFTQPNNRDLVFNVQLLGCSETYFILKETDINYDMRPLRKYLMGILPIVSAVTLSTAHEKLIVTGTFRSLHFPLRESDPELNSF